MRARDTKGIYAAAGAEKSKKLYGIDDPYEPPRHPEIRLETISESAEDNARQILKYLLDRAFFKGKQLALLVWND